MVAIPSPALTSPVAQAALPASSAMAGERSFEPRKALSCPSTRQPTFPIIP